MKTLRNPKDKEEIIRRLDAIRPESQRLWGRMSAHQMVCHLSDSFRSSMGEKPVTPAPGWFARRLMMWFALYMPLPWPKGVKTRPEMDQLLGGTPPVEFGSDKLELQRLLDHFTRQPVDYNWTPHPIFGAMSGEERMRWGYLHMDHHLRQFGA